VYSFGVLHHTLDTQKAINEVHRVLKPGGKAIIMLYHKGFRYYLKIHFYYGVLHGEYLKYGIKDLVNQRTEEFFHSPITRVYTREGAKALFGRFARILSSNAFRIDDNIWVFGKFFQLSDYLPRFLRRAIEQRIGWNVVIKAQK
jgi:SAM-dependent methyltransferase